jgi:hypothetical protein
MQRKLRKEVEDAKVRVKIEEEEKEEEEEEEEKDDNDTSQVDNGGYKVIAGERLCDAPVSDGDITLGFLTGKQLVVKYKIQGQRNLHIWHRGKVNGKNRNKYSIIFDDGETLDDALRLSRYGVDKWWVIVEKVPT